MSNDNSRLVYSTDSGRISEPESKVERPKGMALSVYSVKLAAVKVKVLAL